MYSFFTFRCSSLPYAVWTFATLLCISAGASADEIDRVKLDFFENKIRPLLVDHCYDCHSVDSGESEGELLLDSAAAMKKGGSHGAVLIAGKPDQSLLVRAIEYKKRDLLMPPDQKLPAEAIQAVRKWIAMGAPDPRKTSAVSAKQVSPLDRDPKSHWAFVVPTRPSNVPVASHSARDAIDAFVNTRAKEQSLMPSPIASPNTLVRRLYFDLTGLPPTPDQIIEMTESDSPAAYARVVDRLLASPEFAERFARHWMDVARYADTVGYALAGKERRIKGSERYRDWLIRAFATDMPYDEMVTHQLTADRTDPKNERGNLDAMGFLTVGRGFLNPLDTVDDRIDVISRGLQGLTVACARCHDHKFDPIPTTDYYSLHGILGSSRWKKDGLSPLMMVDKPKGQVGDYPVLKRGQAGNRGPLATRQFFTALRRDNEQKFTDGSGRFELAKRIASKDNPLTARVMVNRVWNQLIGKPLVESPSDFGFRTPPPAIPEVLDDLAVDFSQHWSIKRLVRRIVLTKTYKQSSRAGQTDVDRDPDNRWLARGNRRRRDFESLRDSILLSSGLLDRTMGGPSVEVTLPTPSFRRTVYAMIDRQNLPSLFRTFDLASPDAHSPERYFTTVPQQALFLMNGVQITKLARKTAQRIRSDADSDSATALIDAAFRRLLSRSPSAAEQELGSTFLSQPAENVDGSKDPRKLWQYGTSEVNSQFKPTDFQPFKVYQKGRWQSGKEFPTKPPMGHAFLGKDGGHPGNSNDQSVVRRYTAPVSGMARVLGVHGHRGDQGDGVLTSIWIGDKRIAHGRQKKSNNPFGPFRWRIKKGETVQFVASPDKSSSFDSFFWRTRIKITGDDGSLVEADSVLDFSGPIEAEDISHLDRLEQLAQALMMSNEFAFVD